LNELDLSEPDEGEPHPVPVNLKGRSDKFGHISTRKPAMRCGRGSHRL